MNERFSFMLRLFCFICIFCVDSSQLWAQTKSVTGQVIDAGGEPVIGASILVKGTENGTITDIDGNFKLANVANNAKLVISYIGYNKQEVAVAGKTSVKVTLVENSQTLDEVVVVGYGVQRRSDLTGAVTSVKATKALKEMPVSSITTALQGRLAGVQIVQGSGDPGTEATIRVRGINSLKADAGPLVVIDGFIGGNLENLNPGDIESIEVLKDASAASVYGSRGSNGVILVTTKTAEKGKTITSYNGYANLKTPYELPTKMTAGELARSTYVRDLESAALTGDKPKEYFTLEQVEAYERGELPSYDYIGNIFRKVSLEQTHEISVVGGSEKTSFLVSGSFNSDNGIVYNSWAKKFNYRAKLDTQICKWAKIGVNLWGLYSQSSAVRFSQYRGVLLEALTFPSTVLPQDANGNYNNFGVTSSDPRYNPMGHIWEPNKDGYSYKTWLQGYIQLNLLKGLTFQMHQGVSFDEGVGSQTWNAKSYDTWTNGQTAASVSSPHNYSWINTNTLTYIKEFNESHRLNVMFTFEQQYNNDFKVSASATGITSNKIGHNNLTFSQATTGSSDRSEATLLSYIARFNYALFNRYIFQVSGRRDGSSRLAVGHQWENFLSGSMAWDIKQESFMKNVDPVSRLKLRASYGEIGNQGVAPYSANSKLSAGRDAYNNLTYLTSSLGNDLLAWERTSSINIGLDLGFFNNRLTLTVDAYQKDNDNVLLNVRAPSFTNFGTIMRNSARLQSKGIEVTIEADPIVTKNFRWNTTLTLTSNRTKVKKIYTESGNNWLNLARNGYEDQFFRVIEGESIGTLWGYNYLGVWKSWELDQAPKGTEAGSCRYENLSGDKEGLINQDDAKILGNGQPKFNWGWTNTLNYKDFDLSLFIIGFHGFDIYNYTKSQVGTYSDFLNRWRVDNENTDIPGTVLASNSMNPSSRWVEKGDFVKVKSITIGYSLPRQFLHSIGLSNVRFYVSIQNPFLFTQYSGIDPEVTLKDPLSSGVDWGYYPNGKNYLMGLNLSF